jgi:ribose transport system ATP-binding protein
MNEGPEAALEVEQLSKSFGGNLVLRNASLRVASGEIRALLGANGSGKSTLVKLLAGVHRPDGNEGRIAVGGMTISLPVTAAKARAAGLRFVHQELGLVDRRPVYENLAYGRPFVRRRYGAINWKRERLDAKLLLREFSATFEPDQLVGTLSRAQQAMLAIIRAFARDPRSPLRLLVLDEPTAGLPPGEVNIVIDTMRAVAGHGVGVVFVSHSLAEVERACATVTVMRDGQVVLDAPLTDRMRNTLIEAITGHHPELYAAAGEHHETIGGATGHVALSVRGLRTDSLRGVDFDLRAGEILGVVGDLDSGATDLLPALAGDRRHECDALQVAGEELRRHTVAAARAAGLVYVPVKRATEATLPGLTVRENLTAGNLDGIASRFRIRPRAERQSAVALIERFGIVPRSPSALIETLSGGNQQKVVLARSLRSNPAVVLLDEPTQGVDIGGKEQIHRHIREAAAGGCAFLVCSTEIESLVSIADRVLVLSQGRVTDIVTGDRLTLANVHLAMFPTDRAA